MCSMAAIGLIPTVPIFVIAYMRLEEMASAISNPPTA
jgi:hypothetical protein